MIIDSSVDEVARLEAEPKGMRETDVRDFLSARLRDADRADEKSPTLFLLVSRNPPKFPNTNRSAPLSRILRHALGLLNGVLGACVCAACVCLPVSTRAMPPQPRQPCRRAPGCVLAPLGNREIAVGGESVAMHPFCVGWLG